MLDHNGAGIARLLERCEEDEQAMVAITPGAGLAALAAGDPPDLRRAGLPAHLEVGEGEAARARRAGAVHHFPHGVAHLLEMIGIVAECLRLRPFALDEARTHL